MGAPRMKITLMNGPRATALPMSASRATVPLTSVPRAMALPVQ